MFVFYRNDVTLNSMKKLIVNDYKVLDTLKENPNQTRESIASELKINKGDYMNSDSFLLAFGMIPENFDRT